MLLLEHRGTRNGWPVHAATIGKLPLDH
jgi:hypothetical protein